MNTVKPLLLASAGFLLSVPLWAQEKFGHDHTQEGKAIVEDTVEVNRLDTRTTSWQALGVDWRTDSEISNAPAEYLLNDDENEFDWAQREVLTRPLGKGDVTVRAAVLPENFSGTGLRGIQDQQRRDDFALSGMRGQSKTQLLDFDASYRLPLNADSAVSGSMGTPGAPALGPSASGIQRFFGFDDQYAPFISNWLYGNNLSAGVFTVGYTWRNFRFESSSFSRRAPDRVQEKPSFMRMDSNSKRLSFSPAQNWMLQLSRGHLSSLDQLEPNRDIKRTTFSATYNRNFSEGNWQTILAWGRNSGKFRESTNGYLVESTVKLTGQHAFFGRMEQVGSDDLMRENEAFQRQLFKMNKLTVGYAYDVRTAGAVKFDVGALMSRHYVPAAAASSYGDNRVSYFMFIRFKLK